MENKEAIEYIKWMREKFHSDKSHEACDLAISALEKQKQTNTQNIDSMHASRPNALESLDILEQAKDNKGCVPMSLVRQAFRNVMEQDRWIPCSEKPEYDFQNVLVRWHDKRKGCEKDYYLFEGYVVRGIWCGLFEDVDISDFEPIEWKPLEPYMEVEQ